MVNFKGGATHLTVVEFIPASPLVRTARRWERWMRSLAGTVP